MLQFTNGKLFEQGFLNDDLSMLVIIFNRLKLYSYLKFYQFYLLLLQIMKILV
jgi:hypothetical protein